jgi:hypothetical protein
MKWNVARKWCPTSKVFSNLPWRIRQKIIREEEEEELR